ncbi:glycerophosphodiester phosphodiesterase family protein [Reinekea thalattae]|nr:glycerophosphodiester phosphodiesterase family protein [Reinekea thalattae]
MNKPMPSLIGHRGLPDLAPENTKSSVVTAAKHGIRWVEIDVTMAGDGSLVIMHDPDLRLFGQAETRLVDIGKSELSSIDAGSWFDSNFTGEPLLFLPELLDLVIGHNLGLNLEIKINPDIDMSLQVKAVYQCLSDFHITAENLLISSFDMAALVELRKLDQNIQIGALAQKIPDQTPSELAFIAPVSIHCDQEHLTQEQAAQLKEQYPLYCYTVNSAEKFAQLLSWGVSGIFCDRAHAEDMIAVLTHSSN